MEKTFRVADGKMVLMRMVRVIRENKEYLGEVDGLIGDGDHGMNMNKGFSVFQERFKDSDIDFCSGLQSLGLVLMNEIGGSMGPIYGTMFLSMAKAAEGKQTLTVSDLTGMMTSALSELQELVDARVGDKTLMDTLIPAIEAMQEAEAQGKDMRTMLENMKQAAKEGRDATKDMVARYGRSSRLGERSRGVLDAGSVSCCLLLESMADGIVEAIV